MADRSASGICYNLANCADDDFFRDSAVRSVGDDNLPSTDSIFGMDSLCSGPIR